MASRYWRFLDLRKLGPSQQQAHDQVMDAGAYSHLEVHVRVPVPGTGGAGAVKLQHAATNEEDAFMDLMSFNLFPGSPGGYQSADHFLRYLRWATDSGVAGNPLVIGDLIAKE